jgi:hypothetical protein
MALSIKTFKHDDRGSKSLGHSPETDKDRAVSTVTNAIRQYSLSRIGHPELFTPSEYELNSRPRTAANPDRLWGSFSSRNNN